MRISRFGQIKTQGQPAERCRQCIQNPDTALGKIKCLTALIVMYPCFLPDNLKEQAVQPEQLPA